MSNLALMDAERLTFDTTWAPQFDAQNLPPKASLAIFSTPRTGSQTLCRLLYTVGLGVPAEYFLKRVMDAYGERFLGAHPSVDASFMKDYVQAIRAYRCRNGRIAYKIHADQHRELTADLGKPWEDTLPGLTIIRLRRRDVIAQVVSLGAALQTGIWDDASRELLKKPSALNEAVAEKWTEYIFRSEKYWDRYLKDRQHRLIGLFCEDLADAGKLQDALHQLGTEWSRQDIVAILERLPRSSHNRELSQDLMRRFGAHISRHWEHLLMSAPILRKTT